MEDMHTGSPFRKVLRQTMNKSVVRPPDKEEHASMAERLKNKQFTTKILDL